MRPGTAAVDRLLGLRLIERIGEYRLRATSEGRIILNEIVLRLASALEPADGVVS
jgi:hypothetical protein